MNCFQNRTNSSIMITEARIEWNQYVKMFQIVNRNIFDGKNKSPELIPGNFE